MIPRIIHHIWIGNSLLPHSAKAAIESSIKINSEWEHRLWGNNDIPTFGVECERKVLDSRHPITASDVLRYFILAKHGGLYLDVDMVAIKPVSKTICDDDELVTNPVGRQSLIMNNFIACSADHRVLKEVSAVCRTGPVPTMHGAGSVLFGSVLTSFWRVGGRVNDCGHGAYFHHDTDQKWEWEP